MMTYSIFSFFSPQERVSLCSSATLSIDQNGLKFRDPPAPASQVLELKPS